MCVIHGRQGHHRKTHNKIIKRRIAMEKKLSFNVFAFGLRVSFGGKKNCKKQINKKNRNKTGLVVPVHSTKSLKQFVFPLKQRKHSSFYLFLICCSTFLEHYCCIDVFLVSPCESNIFFLFFHSFSLLSRFHSDGVDFM